MPEIKERPILFSAPMVRAILEGRKTVTRRTVKGQYLEGPWSVRPASNPRTEGHTHDWWLPTGSQPYTALNPCPYGKPGDRLWVRETHADIGCRLTYRADTDDGAHCQVKKWTPAIHMFRRHSRILLEITDVRVERLHDITKEQAMAEGVRIYTDHAELGDWWHVEGIETYSADPRKSFELLWSSVGGDWQANPWVWVVEFKRVTP
ncbi:hypothetical protein [Pseudomonas poae]|uniref:hypothetical protein n=1 Tax=Pseudomonas poae TaxID=200451 RepID=UPI0030CD872C